MIIKKHKKNDSQVLLLGGIDPTGGAGLFRDAQVCVDLNVKFISVSTGFAHQSHEEYFFTLPTSSTDLEKIWSRLDFQKISVIKLGMLVNRDIVAFLTKKIIALKKTFSKLMVVWDPVIFSSSRGVLLDYPGFIFAKNRLLPLVDIITPNAYEFLMVSGTSDFKFLWQKHVGYSGLDDLSWDADFIQSALVDFYKQQRQVIYLKGGHLPQKSQDYFYDGQSFEILKSRRVGASKRGTGCFFATAVACFLAKGERPFHACQKAKKMMNADFKKTS